MQISIFTEVTSCYVIRLTHFFAAGNSHEHYAIPKTVPELTDTLQRVNCVAAEIHY